MLLQDRLRQAIDRLNPDIPLDARHDALTKIIAVEMPSLIAENRRLHRVMVEGVTVEYYDTDGAVRGDKVRLIDFDDPDANDWLVMDQFTVIENGINRRPGKSMSNRCCGSRGRFSVHATNGTRSLNFTRPALKR